MTNMALKNKLRTIIPTNCFNPKLPNSSESMKKKTPVSKQNSLQRISYSDLQDPGSLLSFSDISNSLIGTNLHVFTLVELKMITKSFSSSNYLGEGGFGPVHKGFIDDKLRPCLAAQPVAVKLLDLDGNQGHKEWLTEVIFLGQLRHPHLVKLIGYCCEDEQRLLVYEYMARGNLENQLFRRYSISLAWSTRMKIAVGAAKGLAFLHGEEKPVIYRDFKASNILLDSDYSAKLSDFGLAKDGPEGDETHVSTRVMGTHGYAAPEYIMTGHLTKMSDVYSFGVVLLELLTGRRALDKSRPSREQNLVDWARPILRDYTKLERFMDPRLEGQYSAEGARKAALLAHRCLSHHAKLRPSMSAVVNTLEPLVDLDYDMPTKSFVYVVPSEEVKSDPVIVERESGNEKEKENGNEKEKERKGKVGQRKGLRHRHGLRSSRSNAIYSDTALYMTMRNGLR